MATFGNFKNGWICCSRGWENFRMLDSTNVTKTFIRIINVIIFLPMPNIRKIITRLWQLLVLSTTCKSTNPVSNVPIPNPAIPSVPIPNPPIPRNPIPSQLLCWAASLLIPTDPIRSSATDQLLRLLLKCKCNSRWRKKTIINRMLHAARWFWNHHRIFFTFWNSMNYFSNATANQGGGKLLQIKFFLWSVCSIQNKGFPKETHSHPVGYIQ